jgi:hypothetical protein
LSYTHANDKCFGLAFAEGKGMGPYQAGVMSSLIKQMAQENRTY